MANVQHIFTSDTDPIGVAPPGSHHINSLSGDIWLYGGEWELIHQGGSSGNVGFYSGPPVIPNITPKGAALYSGGSGESLYFKSPNREWREITLTPNPE